MTRALRSGSLELKNDEHEEIDYKTESSKRYDIIDVGILCLEIVLFLRQDTCAFVADASPC